MTGYTVALKKIHTELIFKNVIKKWMCVYIINMNVALLSEVDE